MNMKLLSYHGNRAFSTAITSAARAGFWERRATPSSGLGLRRPRWVLFGLKRQSRVLCDGLSPRLVYSIPKTDVFEGAWLRACH